LFVIDVDGSGNRHEDNDGQSEGEH